MLTYFNIFASLIANYVNLISLNFWNKFIFFLKLIKNNIILIIFKVFFIKANSIIDKVLYSCFIYYSYNFTSIAENSCLFFLSFYLAYDNIL